MVPYQRLLSCHTTPCSSASPTGGAVRGRTPLTRHASRKDALVDLYPSEAATLNTTGTQSRAGAPAKQSNPSSHATCIATSRDFTKTVSTVCLWLSSSHFTLTLLSGAVFFRNRSYTSDPVQVHSFSLTAFLYQLRIQQFITEMSVGFSAGKSSTNHHGHDHRLHQDIHKSTTDCQCCDLAALQRTRFILCHLDIHKSVLFQFSRPGHLYVCCLGPRLLRCRRCMTIRSRHKHRFLSLTLGRALTRKVAQLWYFHHHTCRRCSLVLLYATSKSVSDLGRMVASVA